jgi:hypothetical protein
MIRSKWLAVPSVGVGMVVAVRVGGGRAIVAATVVVALHSVSRPFLAHDELRCRYLRVGAA